MAVTINRLYALVLALIFSLAAGLTAPPAQANSGNRALEEQVLQIIRQHPEVILESVEAYQSELQERAEEEQRQLLQAIQADPQVYIAASPVNGSLDAALRLIEFSDFQCPYCSLAHGTLKQFVADHSDDVALVYKHYPLAQIHPEAMPAAAAAWAAQQQGQFWPYQDFLFEHQDQLGEALYQEAASALGLDIDRFELDRSSAAAFERIYEDMGLAEQLGLSGTPFFVLNGEVFSGALEASFLEAKLAELVETSNEIEEL